MFPEAPYRRQNVANIEILNDGYSKYLTLSPSMIRRLDGSEVTTYLCHHFQVEMHVDVPFALLHLPTRGIDFLEVCAGKCCQSDEREQSQHTKSLQ